jgi:fluoride ion exporter CrcB/FEX
MRQFIAKIWKLIVRARVEGATLREIYEAVADGGFPGTFNTFSTYCREVARLTPAQRGRLGKSKS